MTHAALLRSKFRLGKELIAAKRFEEARSVYQQICAKLKTDADSWFTLVLAEAAPLYSAP